jgi:hypothetical protein
MHRRLGRTAIPATYFRVELSLPRLGSMVYELYQIYEHIHPHLHLSSLILDSLGYNYTRTAGGLSR